MMSDLDTHKALLAMQDRTYRAMVKFARQHDFELPESGGGLYAWLLDEATRGIAHAQFYVAKLLYLGLYVDQDKNKARAWCERAVQERYSPAITMLAGFYETGSAGLRADLTRAVELWRLAADLQESGAMCALAGMYLDGRHFKKDQPIGLDLLRKAAQLGDSLAQCELGVLLIDADDPALEAEGLAWFRAAADNDSPVAHRHLAHFYRYGEHGLLVDSAASTVHSETAEKLESVFL
jgi:TPR repeat protein